MCQLPAVSHIIQTGGNVFRLSSFAVKRNNGERFFFLFCFFIPIFVPQNNASHMHFLN